MKLSVIVLNYNTKQLTANCLKSLEKNLSSELKKQSEVILVDNHSSDGSAIYIKQKFPWVKLVESKKNLGFTGGNNLGIKKSKGDFVLLLNSDTLISRNSLENLLAFMENSSFAIGSCKLTNEDGSFQPNSGNLPKLGAIFMWLSNLDDLLNKFGLKVPTFHQKILKYYQDARQVGWVSGSVMIIRQSLFRKVGLLDEKLFMYAEDVEFCLRASRAKQSIGWTNQATITHLGGRSSYNSALTQWQGEFAGLIYIYKKYYGLPKRILLRFMIYLFTTLRIIAYLLRGKIKYSLTYLKILFSLNQKNFAVQH